MGHAVEQDETLTALYVYATSGITHPQREAGEEPEYDGLVRGRRYDRTVGQQASA